MESKQRKSSAARIKANRKYMEKTYKKLQVMIKPEEYNLIDTHCKNNGVSKASFIFNACKYIIDNNIDLPQEIPNAETLEAMAEVKEMKINPSEYKSYTSIQELMDDLKTDD